MYFILFYFLSAQQCKLCSEEKNPNDPCIKFKELLSVSLLNKALIQKIKIAILGDWSTAQFNSECDPRPCKFIFHIMHFTSSPVTEIGEENKSISNPEIILKYYFIEYLIQITKIITEFQNYFCDLWDLIW